jgi:cytochrome c biogenesis protein CcdA
LASNSPAPETPSVGPTRIRGLVALFIVGAMLGFGFARLTIAFNGVAPQIEWSAVVVLMAVAAIVLLLANSTHRILHRERRSMDPHRAFRFLLLGKASALVGAIMAGAYLGFAADFVNQLDVTLPEQRVVRSVFAAVSALILLLAGLLLERACRIPKDEDT